MAEHYLPAEEQEAEKNLRFQTKNVLNNSGSLFDAARLKGKNTFSKDERLTNVTVIDKIFSEGKSVNIGGFALLYFPQLQPALFPAQVTFAVAKRNFKHAHDRNRIKRLMRECWRKEKFNLYENLQQKNLQYAICLMYRGKTIPDFASTEAAIKKLVERLSNK
jgi:ribonuclease P protein component